MKGFGDFVPGQNQDDPYATPKLVLGAIYVLFGMAILAMCFDLMQEEIIAKFTWLGKKFFIFIKTVLYYFSNLLLQFHVKEHLENGSLLFTVRQTNPKT